MNEDKLLKVIGRVFKKSGSVFWKKNWKDFIGTQNEMVGTANKLLMWIDKEISTYAISCNINTPALKGIINAKYLMTDFDSWLDDCKNLAVLCQFKTMLEDDSCSKEVIQNIEYSICKIYNLKYSKELQQFIKKGEDEQ